MMNGLKRQVLGVNELLRHFWRGFPMNSKSKMNKMQRIVRALEQLYTQSQVMMTAAAPADKAYVLQMLRPSMHAMDVALQKYDAHMCEARAGAAV
jgi:hypothetical protein